MGSVLSCCLPANIPPPPDIETLREDPNIINCIKITGFGRVKQNIGPGSTTHLLAGGYVMYYTNEHLVHLFWFLGNIYTQYLLSDIKKIELIRENSVILYDDESVDLPREPGSDTGIGVRITTKPSDDGYYSIIVFGSLDAEQFVSNLSQFLEKKGIMLE